MNTSTLAIIENAGVKRKIAKTLVHEDSFSKRYAVEGAKVKLVGENNFGVVDYDVAVKLQELKRKSNSSGKIVQLKIDGENIETELGQIKQIKFYEIRRDEEKADWAEELENAKIFNVWLDENGKECEKNDAKFEARVWRKENGEKIIEREKIIELFELGESVRDVKHLWRYGVKVF